MAARLIAVVARLVAEYRRNTWALHAFDDLEDDYEEDENSRDSSTSGSSTTKNTTGRYRKVTRTVSVADMMAGQGDPLGASTKSQGTGCYTAGLGSARAAAASVYRATAARGDESSLDDDDSVAGSDVSSASVHHQQIRDSETWARMQSVAQTLARLGNALEHALDLLQGALLLHAPSRGLYARKAAMLGILELLVYDKQVASQVSGSETSAVSHKRSTSGGAAVAAPLDESSLVIMHLPDPSCCN